MGPSLSSPTEYWHPEFLVGVFRPVGSVIKLDGNMAQGLVGHFARVLVEVDLTSPLIDSVRVGLPNNLFYVDFSYENVPLLCSFCHYVGHSIDKCRKAKAADSEPKPAGTNKAKERPAKQHWVEIENQNEAQQRHDKRPSTSAPVVRVNNAFDALQDLEDVEDSFSNDNNRTSSHAKTVFSVNSTTQESSSTNEVPETPVEQLHNMLTSPELCHGPEYAAAKERLMEQSRALARTRQINAELQAKKRTDSLQVLADQVGQPKDSSFAPNSPHPAHKNLEEKLQAARDVGKNPTAYEIEPGGSKNLKSMDNVATEQWQAVAEDSTLSDYEEEIVGDSPSVVSQSF